MAKKYNYVDGFIIPVPRKNLAKYKKMAKLAARVWKDHGAIDYVECMADDVKKGKVTSFPQAVKLKPGEVVFFSWATYKSKSDSNRAMKKIMADPRFENMGPNTMPFDGMRMFWGGFKPMVKA
jgi:uncharacterized protein YbaA (DUF1428 family)